LIFLQRTIYGYFGKSVGRRRGGNLQYLEKEQLRQISSLTRNEERSLYRDFIFPQRNLTIIRFDFIFRHITK